MADAVACARLLQEGSVRERRRETGPGETLDVPELLRTSSALLWGSSRSSGSQNLLSASVRRAGLAGQRC